MMRRGRTGVLCGRGFFLPTAGVGPVETQLGVKALFDPLKTSSWPSQAAPTSGDTLINLISGGANATLNGSIGWLPNVGFSFGSASTTERVILPPAFSRVANDKGMVICIWIKYLAQTDPVTAQARHIAGFTAGNTTFNNPQWCFYLAGTTNNISFLLRGTSGTNVITTSLVPNPVVGAVYQLAFRYRPNPSSISKSVRIYVNGTPRGIDVGTVTVLAVPDTATHPTAVIGDPYVTTTTGSAGIYGTAEFSLGRAWVLDFDESKLNERQVDELIANDYKLNAGRLSTSNSAPTLVQDVANRTGTLALYDVKNPLSWPKQDAADPGDVITNMISGGEDAVVDPTGDKLNWVPGSGLAFSSWYKNERILLPAAFRPGLNNTGFTIGIWFKLLNQKGPYNEFKGIGGFRGDTYTVGGNPWAIMLGTSDNNTIYTLVGSSNTTSVTVSSLGEVYQVVLHYHPATSSALRRYINGGAATVAGNVTTLTQPAAPYNSYATIGDNINTFEGKAGEYNHKCDFVFCRAWAIDHAASGMTTTDIDNLVVADWQQNRLRFV